MADTGSPITIRLTNEQHERLRVAAAAAGFSVHAVAKQSIILGLQQFERLYGVSGDNSHTVDGDKSNTK